MVDGARCGRFAGNRLRQATATAPTGHKEVRTGAAGGWAGSGGSSGKWPFEVRAGAAGGWDRVGGSSGKRQRGGEGRSRRQAVGDRLVDGQGSAVRYGERPPEARAGTAGVGGLPRHGRPCEARAGAASRWAGTGGSSPSGRGGEGGSRRLADGAGSGGSSSTRPGEVRAASRRPGIGGSSGKRFGEVRTGGNGRGWKSAVRRASGCARRGRERVRRTREFGARTTYERRWICPPRHGLTPPFTARSFCDDFVTITVQLHSRVSSTPVPTHSASAETTKTNPRFYRGLGTSLPGVPPKNPILALWAAHSSSRAAMDGQRWRQCGAGTWPFAARCRQEGTREWHGRRLVRSSGAEWPNPPAVTPPLAGSDDAARRGSAWRSAWWGRGRSRGMGSAVHRASSRKEMRARAAGGSGWAIGIPFHMEDNSARDRRFVLRRPAEVRAAGGWGSSVPFHMENKSGRDWWSVVQADRLSFPYGRQSGQGSAVRRASGRRRRGPERPADGRR